MSSRFQELYRLQPKLYLEGSPVLIEAGALQKDTFNDKVLVQLKLRNLSSKSIIACKVKIWAYEPNGDEIEGVNNFSYLDIDVSTGSDFASKTPIYLPNNNTRRFAVAVTEVVFNDNSLWTADLAEWSQIPVQKTVVGMFHDPELVKQYELEAGSSSAFVPMISRGLFLCTCGTVNLESSKRCYKCNKSYDDLSRIINEDYLIQKKDARLKKEREEREAAEIAEKAAAEATRLKADEQRRKTIKILKFVSLIAAAIAITVLATIVMKTVIIPEIKYNSATKQYNSQQYEEAYKVFNSLNYKDSADKAVECLYSSAMELYNSQQYEEAYKVFNSINYKDSADKAAECSFMKQKSRLTNVTVGTTIKFGFYEQDNNTSNGKEEIEWKVLAVEGNKALIISQYALDCQQYNTAYTSVTWENCTLRKWLNETFYNEAFGPYHQQMVSNSTVTDDKNKSKDVLDIYRADKYLDSLSRFNSTTDKVFLLSQVDAWNKEYFDFVPDLDLKYERQCKGTAFCFSQGVQKNSDGYCMWWLRSSNHRGYHALIVDSSGGIDQSGISVTTASVAVRPALWIDLGS